MKVREMKNKIVVKNSMGFFTIFTTPHGGAGPGYISRWKHRNGTLIVDDIRAGSGFLNDPRYGGIGTFGWQHARKLEREDYFISDRPWHLNNAWPIDGRNLAKDYHGFGVTDAKLLSVRKLKARPPGILVNVSVAMGDPWDSEIVSLVYHYCFFQHKVGFNISGTFVVRSGPEAFFKEPKIQFTVGPGLGCRKVTTFRSKVATELRRGLPKTTQSPPSDRIEFLGKRRIRISHINESLSDLSSRVADLEKFGVVDSPGDGVQWDCHGGIPRSRFELIGWGEKGDFRNAAVLATGWQGGRGPYDCEPLSRKISPSQFTFSGVIKSLPR